MSGSGVPLFGVIDWTWLPAAFALALFGGYALLLIRWGRTFPCPACRRQVSRAVIRKEEIICPLCGWGAVLVGSQEDRVETGPTPTGTVVQDACGYCGRPLRREDAVRLWDGRDYCRECVEGSCPDLGEHAARHDRLEETMPHAAWKVARKFFVLIGGPILSVFGLLAFLAGLSDGGLLQGLWFLATVLLLIGPMILLFTVAHGFGFANKRPSVSVANGQLEVRIGDLWSATYPLTDCQWCFGDSKQMNLLEKALPLSGPAVLIVLPREEGGQDKLVPVGFSEDTHRRWAAFLTLAGVARRAAWERRLPLWRKALNVFAAVVLLPAAFVGCSALGALSHGAVVRLTGDAGFGQVMAMVCICPGAFYVCFLIALVWPWKAMKQVPSRRSLADRRKVQRKLIVGFVTGSAIFVGLPLVLQPGLSPLARLAGGILPLSSGYLAGWDLGRRWANLEWETAEPGSQRLEPDM